MKTKFLINNSVILHSWYLNYLVYVFYLPASYKYRLFKNFSGDMRGIFGLYNSRIFKDELEIKHTENLEK